MSTHHVGLVRHRHTPSAAAATMQQYVRGSVRLFRATVIPARRAAAAAAHAQTASSPVKLPQRVHFVRCTHCTTLPPPPQASNVDETPLWIGYFQILKRGKKQSSLKMFQRSQGCMLNKTWRGCPVIETKFSAQTLRMCEHIFYLLGSVLSAELPADNSPWVDNAIVIEFLRWRCVGARRRWGCWSTPNRRRLSDMERCTFGLWTQNPPSNYTPGSIFASVSENPKGDQFFGGSCLDFAEKFGWNSFPAGRWKNKHPKNQDPSMSKKLLRKASFSSW